MTKKLYQIDSYVAEFDAVITDKRTIENNVGIILDSTHFYPTAGGQQSDRGTINSKQVIDVIEEGNEIIHILNEVPSGQKVHCRIDWKRRFDFMQQHTGQHILSQCFVREQNAPTISAHMGEARNTLDIGTKVLSWDDINKIERYANQIVMKGLPVRIHMYENIQECPFDLRKHPVVEGNIRVIEIADFDATPCCGTHCRNTGEVGLIKIISFEKYKGGYRIEFLCGSRALTDYQSKVIILSALKNELNAKEDDLVQAAKKLRESEKILKKQLDIASKEYNELLCDTMIQDYRVNPIDNLIVKELHDYSLDKLKRLAMVLTEKIDVSVLFFSRQEQINIVIARSKKLTINLKEKCTPVLVAHKWRGGGFDCLLTGALPNETDMNSVIEEIMKEMESG